MRMGISLGMGILGNRTHRGNGNGKGKKETVQLRAGFSTVPVVPSEGAPEIHGYAYEKRAPALPLV